MGCGQVNDEDDGAKSVSIRCFRRYQDFYLLEQKLTEFHGVFSDARLPARRSATTARNLEFLQSIKKDFEHFLRVGSPVAAHLSNSSSCLQHLLSKPTLRNSELLSNFLTQPDEFTLPNGEIILCKTRSRLRSRRFECCSSSSQDVQGRSTSPSNRGSVTTLSRAEERDLFDSVSRKDNISIHFSSL